MASHAFSSSGQNGVRSMAMKRTFAWLNQCCAFAEKRADIHETILVHRVC
jgi:hypothetical protein